MVVVVEIEGPPLARHPPCPLGSGKITTIFFNLLRGIAWRTQSQPALFFVGNALGRARYNAIRCTIVFGPKIAGSIFNWSMNPQCEPVFVAVVFIQWTRVLIIVIIN